MARFSKPTRPQAKRIIQYATAAIVGVQIGALATVVAIDEMRKRRSPQTGVFPHLPPQDVTVGANDFEIYTYGQDLYDAMLEDIASAKKTIFFESFIVKSDETGYLFRDALIAAAMRGVDVHIILDTWGNLNQDPRFRHYPRMANLHYINFPLIRTGLLTGRERDKGRDHRKIMTVDSTVGYVGGYNIGTIYAHHWRDTHLRVEGPLAGLLNSSLVTMWNSYHQQDDPRLETAAVPEWDPTVRIVENAPSRAIYPINALYLEALNRATSRAWITMGYFIPDEPMMEALTSAARRGVDVRVLIPEYSNHIYADWVARSHYSELLESGVKIYLYEEAMVHAKTMAVDGQWSTVGTANIDRLSLRGNFEINVEVYGAPFTQAMERIFKVDLANSHELTLNMWNQRSRSGRVLERVLRPLAPLM